jgi:ribosomal protein S18 acetylase RimI-like enzyme
MSNILIREANKKDLSDILRLNLVLFEKEFKEFDKSLNVKWTYSQKGKDYFNKRIIDKESFVAVAIDNKEVVGYICCGLHDDNTKIAKKAELENIMVTAEYRGQKIGSKLVKMFFEWCKSKKIKNILVTASGKNLSGIRFYKKFGFNDYDVTLEKKFK